MPNSFDYAVVRIVPAVEREEFFNAGVILFCPEQRRYGIIISGFRDSEDIATCSESGFLSRVNEEVASTEISTG